MGESRWLDVVEASERVELDLLRPGNSRLPSVGVAWGVSREQVVSREELETERGWEESKEVLFPSLKDDRWSEAETIEALREAGLVTFLDLDCMGEAEGWKEEDEAAILRLRGESEGRLDAILSLLDHSVNNTPNSPSALPLCFTGETSYLTE